LNKLAKLSMSSDQIELTESQVSQDLVSICFVADVNQMMDYLDRLKKLKKVCDACKVFRENAVNYAKLHAASLMRVVELGGSEKLTGLERRTAEWLASLNEDDRNKYVLMCEEGLTIDSVYRREVEKPLDLKRAVEKALENREKVLQEFVETGYIDLTSHNNIVSTLLKDNKTLAREFKEGTREAVLRNGGTGIGDGSHKYIMPGVENPESVRKSAMSRLESMVNDFISICNDAKKSNTVLSYSDLFGAGKYMTKDQQKKRILFYLFLALRRELLIDDNTLQMITAMCEMEGEISAAKNLLNAI